MPTTDPRIDAYIAAAPPFAQPILERIRKAFHSGCPDVVETLKWGAPCFEHHGMLGNAAAFKAHVVYSFWRGKALDDPHGILVADGKSEMSRSRAESVADLPAQKVLADYVRRAAALNVAPRPKVAKKARAARPAPATPADLKAALSKNPKARAFFEGLPPGHRREYVEWITEAKRDATREKRLATTIEWLAEGKRRNWKYENC